MDDNFIKEELIKFKNKHDYNKSYYEKNKNDDNFKNKNRQNAKLYYMKNKAYINAKNLYNYYIKKDKFNDFKIKHKYKYDILIDQGFFCSTFTGFA
jgi:hypothetical protein